MSCERNKELLVGLLYDELTVEEREQVSEHLASCTRCSGALDRLAEARDLLRESQPGVPPAPRVLVLTPPRRRWALRVAAGFFLAALLLGAGTAAGYYVSRPDGALAGQVGTHADQLDSMARTLEDQRARIQALQQQPVTPAGLSEEQFVAGLRTLANEIEQNRASEMEALYDNLLREIYGVQVRTDQRIGQTEEALQYVVMAASNPRILAQ
jgi:anti-sigma factor RsiW